MEGRKKLKMKMAKPPTRKETANELTKALVKWLNLNGWVVWRQNNAAIYDKKREVYRKNSVGRKGVPDIVGYRKRDGVATFVEVKVGKDRLSDEQRYFIDQAKRSGCVAIVAKNLDDAIEVLSLNK